MPNIVCQRKINCPGTDDPIANLSSEDEEVNNWQSVGYCCDGTIKVASSDLSCEAADGLLDDMLQNDCPECPDDSDAAAITLNSIDDHICQYAAYGDQVTANTASDTLFFELYSGSLPTGLTFHGGETQCGAALIDGAAQEAGDFTFSIRVCDDSGNCAERTYTIHVLGIVNLPMGDGEQGSVYLWTPIVQGGSGNYTFGLLTTLPSGLTFSTVNGSISGTPTTSGDFTVVMTVTDNSTDISCNFIMDFSITATTTGCFVYGTVRTFDAILNSWVNNVRGFYGKGPVTNNINAYFGHSPSSCEWTEQWEPPLSYLLHGAYLAYSASTHQRIMYIRSSHIDLVYRLNTLPDTPAGTYAIDLGSSSWGATPFGAPPSNVVVS